MDTSDAPSSTADADAPREGGPIVIIGAGPAGLTAAFQLTKVGRTATILEADDIVGGISRSPERDGWRFDIGGHRFFTKVKPVEDLWHEILPDEDFLTRPRLSRIFYNGKYYDYPIKPFNALRNLGFVEAVRCGLSFLWVRVRPPKNTDTLEGYIVKNYGWRLYNHFFVAYNIKVWAVAPDKISADWGGQRIKGMSLWSAVWEPFRSRVFGGRKDKSKQVTSLIEEFQYPKYGPGMMWETARDKVVDRGCTVEMETKVTGIRHVDGRATAVVAHRKDGTMVDLPADHVISSMPFPQLLESMEPAVPDEVVTAAKNLHFRDFLTVALVVPEEEGFPDNWIYVHDPQVSVGRIQNFGVWSPYLVKDGRTCLGLEFFVFEGDEMWNKSDEDLIEQGKRELEMLGLVKADKVEQGYVVRMPKAYPVYDDTYKENVAVLRRWLEANTPNVHPVGRNGMHKYNNQDHSMYTAMLTVENILGAHHDIWSVNVDEEYHEQGPLTDGATAPEGAGGTAPKTGRDAPVIARSAYEPGHPLNPPTDS